GTSLNLGVDHNMDRKPWAKALRLISRNALAYGLARLMIHTLLFRNPTPKLEAAAKIKQRLDE
ncbi:MAG: hypothetical protein K9M08_21810, partial [Pirellula sp.]|nr:hypothetical protein [Pirellula sp.]